MKRSDRRLEGKVALITGAAGGIGAASAELFVEQGACVAICDVRGSAEVAARIAPGADRAIGIEMDVSDEASVRAGIDRVVERFGRLDVLFCCASIWLIGPNGYVEGETDGPSELLAEPTWEQTLAVNLKGTYLTCRHGIPRLRETGGGVIITVASVAALRVGDGVSDAYTASKGGVMAMTRTLAVGHAGEGIRCNCLCPGPTETAMLSAMTPERRRAFAEEIPLGRYGSPQDLANVALFLASDESAFMTGSVLVVDGGYSVR